MKTISFSITLLVLANLTFAQSATKKRALTGEELKRFTSVCGLINDALPKAFKNYEYIPKDCGDFASFSLEMDGNGGYNTAVNSKNQAVGFLPTGEVIFTNPKADSVKAQIELSFDYQKYMNNIDSINAQEARMIKTASCKSLKIVVTINTGYADLQEFYHTSTNPEVLNVPKSTFATLYKMTYGKPILEEDGTAQHHSNIDDAYTDRAIIVFGGKPTVRIVKAEQKQNYHIANFNLPDNSNLELLEKIKHVCVFISGDENDIKELINHIDWTKVNDLIGK